MKVLVSGFEPFGEESVNPTAMIVEILAERPANRWPRHQVRTVLLPVTFERAFAVLEAEIRAFDPDVVISLGLAGGRSEKLEFERIAINSIDAFIPDNSGHQPQNEKIDQLGREGFFSTLPIHNLVNSLNAQGVPAKISNSAGTYVCNYLFYKLQESCLHSRRRTGFIHVPYLPEQAVAKSVAVGSMSLEKMVEGVELVIDELIEKTFEKN